MDNRKVVHVSSICHWVCLECGQRQEERIPPTTPDLTCQSCGCNFKNGDLTVNDKAWLIHVEYLAWPTYVSNRKGEYLVYAKDYIEAKAKVDKFLLASVKDKDKEYFHIVLTCSTLI